MNTYAQSVLDQLKKRFPTQKEFLQAATEIIDSLSLVFDRHPEYEKAGILERFVEPERQINFRVTWIDDAGKVQVNTGTAYNILRLSARTKAVLGSTPPSTTPS